MIEIHTPLEWAVASVLTLWLAASVLTALQVPPFVSWFRALRLALRWWMFVEPTDYYHTVEYLDDSGPHPTWVIAGSTEYADLVPFVTSPASVRAEHLVRVISRLERGLCRVADPETAGLISAIEKNLLCHPAIRHLAIHPRCLRIMKRRRQRPVDDAVVWEWTPAKS